MFRRLWRTCRNLVRRQHMEQDLDAELRAYVELAIDEKTNSGMTPAEARRAALLESEGITQVKENVRGVRAGAWLESLFRDLRFGARLAAREPGFTAIAVLMLAVGIGANTAVFSAVSAVLLRGLPYSDPERIVRVYEKRPREANFKNTVSPPDFLDWREQSASFGSMAATFETELTWQNDTGAERVPAAIVSPEFFDVFGVRPAIGTGFLKETEIRGDYFAVILTHAFWQRRFGGDPAVLGRTLTINRGAAVIAGLMAAGFEYPEHDIDLLVPLWWRTRENLDRAGHELTVAGRLKPGISLRAAQAEMDTIAARLEQQFPAVNKGHGANVIPMRDVLLGPIQTPLLILQCAVAFVLLIACGNLANLLLARTLAREREFAVRLAMGAGRGRLIRQLLCESILLAAAGGAAGVAVAYAALPLLRSLVPADLGAPGLRNLQVDATALGACLLLSILCGLLFGLAPAWRGAGAGIASALKEGAVGGGRRGNRLRKALVVSQVALSMVLLTGAGLFLRSFDALRSVDAGIRTHGALTLRLGFPGDRYTHPEQVVRVSTELIDGIRRLPGVTAAGLTSHLPLSGQDGRTGLAIEGVAPPDPNLPRRAHLRYVSPGYFQAMGLRIVQGRPFLDSDRAGSAPVMIVNETAAKRYFPDGKALGHRGHRGGVAGPWAEVVGVVADVRHWGLDVEPRPEQYYCHLQQPTWGASVVVRTGGDPQRLTGSIRTQLRQLDPLIPMSKVLTIDEVVGRSVASERSILILLSVFAAIAIVLTAAGIWGTMAYLLSQRRREIGIRLALGATNSRLVRGVVARAMTPVAAGLVCGVGLAVALSRAISTTLFAVSLTDPATYVAVAILLAAIAWLANYYPATRITKAAPYAVLREE